MFELTSLENGLRIITYTMPHMESVSVGIWIGTGGRYEDDRRSGISHLIEHLVFRGTDTREGQEISQAIEGTGGMLNAFTAEEFTCLYAKVVGKHLPLALEILTDMYQHPAFKPEHLEKEKHIVKEEIHMYLDTPAQHVHDILNQILWPEHPLGKMLIGTEESIDGMTRNDLIDYKNLHYGLRNTVISAAGNVEHSSFARMVQDYLRDATISDIPPFSRVEEEQNKPTVHIMKKDTEQTHLSMGIRAFHRDHPDRYGLKLLSIILGENMSSRLFQEIRERHSLAYSIHSSISRYRDTGAFIISAGIDTKNLVKAVSLILKEVTEIRTTGVTGDEMTRAKEYCIGQLMLGREKTMNIMLWLGENLLCSERVLSMEEIMEKVNAVTHEDVVRIAQGLFVDENLNLAIISPFDRDEELESVLRLS